MARGVVRGVVRVLGVFAVFVALAVDPIVAQADPSDGGQTFSLQDMGTLAPLAFYGSQGTSELTFPVPQGLVPAALKANVELPVNVRSGVITVMQKERTIARIPLPAADQASITIPLTGLAIDEHAATLTLRTFLVPDEGYCLDPANPLRLTNGEISFGGTATPPSTVAEFLPPILRKLTIAIPPAPSKAESDAALRLATAVTAQYGQQPTAVVVTALGDALPAAGPFERQVIIRQSPDTGLSLQPGRGALPDLQISGPDNALTNQTRLLASDLSRLALSSKAVVGPLSNSPQLPGNVTTLKALGQPSVSAVALAPQVSVGLDQTRMGRPAKHTRVHLRGNYTPPPSSVSGRLVALVGGETIDTWPVDGQGSIDHWVEVPDQLLQRYTTLGISLDIAGNTGRCGEFQPLTLTIDGASTVESALAAPPVPAGLQSLPQALMPRMLVGIGPAAFADTVRAAAIAVALQRLSALPIDTAVTTVDDAIASKLPAVIVAGDGWQHPTVRLPIEADNGRLQLDAVVDDGDPTTLTLDPEAKYGSLQVVVQGGRSLLVATSNGAPAQLDQLLGWMSADSRRWSKLDGVAAVSLPGKTPVVIGPQPAISATGNDGADTRKWWAIGGTVAAVGAAVWLLRMRRRGRSAAGDG